MLGEKHPNQIADLPIAEEQNESEGDY